MEEREWWYRTSFEAAPAESGERLRLVFHGLDAFATIWFNRIELGRTDNAFRTWTFDIAEQVFPDRPKQHHVGIGTIELDQSADLDDQLSRACYI